MTKGKIFAFCLFLATEALVVEAQDTIALPSPRYQGEMSVEQALNSRKTVRRFKEEVRLPKSLHNEIEEKLKEQKKHFNVSKNSFIVGLLRAAIDANVKIGLVSETQEEPKKENMG